MTGRVMIALVGSSGAGKTYASLLMQRLYGWKAIVSYTTRRKRDDETNGVEHWFVGKKKMPPRERMCAYTFFGGHHYWTTWEQIYDNLFPFVYVIDEKGLLDLKARTLPMPLPIITVKIERSGADGVDEERKRRDGDRIRLADGYYDYIVENDGTLEEFDEKIKTLCEQINERIYGDTKQ